MTVAVPFDTGLNGQVDSVRVLDTRRTPYPLPIGLTIPSFRLDPTPSLLGLTDLPFQLTRTDYKCSDAS